MRPRGGNAGRTGAVSAGWTRARDRRHLQNAGSGADAARYWHARTKGVHEGRAVAAELVDIAAWARWRARLPISPHYHGFWSAPISGRFRGHDLLECPPSGQGPCALVIARILDGFDLSDARTSEADRIHLLAEATKAAYRVRDLLIADPAHMTVPVETMLDAYVGACAA